MILGFLRGQDHAVGSNRAGAAAPPSWAYLLPSLEALHPHAVGSIHTDTVHGLRSWGEVGTLSPGCLPPAHCRLLLLGPGMPAAWLADLRGATRAMSVWIDGNAETHVAPALGAGDPWWLLPEDAPRGEPGRPGERAAFCLAKPAVAGGLTGLALRIAGRVTRRLGLRRHAIAASIAYARPSVPGGPPHAGAAPAGTLLRPAGAGPGPPEWLERVARDAGHEIARRAWGFLPSRGFLSQKVVFVLGASADADGGEALAVKITQHPAFNARLENERRALGLVGSLPGLPRGSTPRECFGATHRGLTIVGESVLHGVPFPMRSTGRADCAVARRAADWIVTLVIATAKPASGADHAVAIRDVTSRLRTQYPPDDAVERAVEDALRTLERLAGVPTAFLHGDPGEWNVLVSEEGSVRFLDWENAESAGPPTWDLASYLLSYARFGLERDGIRPTPASTARRLLEPSPLADLLVNRHLDLARRLEMPPEAIEPLFLLHSAVAAVREAWRLSPGATGRGPAFRWLQELARRRASSPTLVRLRG